MPIAPDGTRLPYPDDLDRMATAGGMVPEQAGLSGYLPSVDPNAIAALLQAMAAGDRQKIAAMVQEQVAAVMERFAQEQAAAAREALAALQDALARGAMTLDASGDGAMAMEPGERLLRPEDQA